MSNNSDVNETHPPRQIGRSIGAVLAGFAAVIVLSMGTDMALHAAGLTPPLGQRMSDPMFLRATIYRTIYAVLGSYITAWAAPDRPLQHALVGGVIGLILNVVGTVATWNHVPSLGPHWYPLALMVTALPSAWLGGKLRVMQLSARQ